MIHFVLGGSFYIADARAFASFWWGRGVRMKFCWQASSAEQDYVAAKLEAEHREEIAKKAIEDAAAKVAGGKGWGGRCVDMWCFGE